MIFQFDRMSNLIRIRIRIKIEIKKSRKLRYDFSQYENQLINTFQKMFYSFLITF